MRLGEEAVATVVWIFGVVWLPAATHVAVWPAVGEDLGTEDEDDDFHDEVGDQWDEDWQGEEDGGGGEKESCE